MKAHYLYEMVCKDGVTCWGHCPNMDGVIVVIIRRKPVAVCITYVEATESIG